LAAAQAPAALLVSPKKADPVEAAHTQIYLVGMVHRLKDIPEVLAIEVLMLEEGAVARVILAAMLTLAHITSVQWAELAVLEHNQIFLVHLALMPAAAVVAHMAQAPQVQEEHQVQVVRVAAAGVAQ
jgi:hypothetical protein